ncbi:MAG: thiamine phosphate synthase [Deltaproteobacteria bacterium]|nr:thiamine phosphate synthase [Deltaproteobacteria bacterium]
MNPEALRGLYVIVDNTPAPDRSHEEIARAALQGGARVLQLRAKTMGSGDYLRVARALRALTAAWGALLIVNDRVDVAALVSADGVHVGQNDLPPAAVRAILGPGRLVGLSTHSLEQAEAAQAGGVVDYVGFGPMFATQTKVSGRAPRGPEALRAVRARVRLPVVAIGGITQDNVGEVVAAGADAVAVIAAVAGAPDMTAAARALCAAFR